MVEDGFGVVAVRVKSVSSVGWGQSAKGVVWAKAKLTNRSTRPPKLPLMGAGVCLGLVLPVKWGYNQGLFAGGVVFPEAHLC